MDHFEVGIVGGGPTGLVLANFLGKGNVSCVLLEKHMQVLDEPKAIHIDSTVYRIFEELKILDQEMKNNLDPCSEIQYRTKNIALLKLQLGICKTHLSPSSSFWIYQPTLEQRLRGKLTEFKSVKALYGEKVVAVTTDKVSGKVSVFLENRMFTCNYLVACDGANSFIRKSLCVSVKEMGFEQEWLVADFKVHSSELLAKLPFTHYQFCSHNQPLTYIRYQENRIRLETRICRKDDLVDEKYLIGLLNYYLNFKINFITDVSLIRKRIYEFGSQMIVDQPLVGANVLFAGDAAHLMPPFIGQGMCTGIRDAYNLQWRLKFFSKTSKSGEEIVNEYYRERKQEWKLNLYFSVLAGKFIEKGRFLTVFKPFLFILQKTIIEKKVNRAFEYKISFFKRKRASHLKNVKTINVNMKDGYIDDLINGNFCMLTHEKITEEERKIVDILKEAIGFQVLYVNNENQGDWANVTIDSDDFFTLFQKNRFLLIRPDKYIIAKGALQQRFNSLNDLKNYIEK